MYRRKKWVFLIVAVIVVAISLFFFSFSHENEKLSRENSKEKLLDKKIEQYKKVSEFESLKKLNNEYEKKLGIDLPETLIGLNMFNAELGKTKSILDFYQIRIDTLNLELKNKVKIYEGTDKDENLDSELTEYTYKMEELELQIRYYEDQISIIEKRIEILRREREENTAEINFLTMQKLKHEKELSEKSKKVAEYMSKIDKLEEKVGLLRATDAKYQAKIKMFKSRITYLQKKTEKLKKMLTRYSNIIPKSMRVEYYNRGKHLEYSSKKGNIIKLPIGLVNEEKNIVQPFVKWYVSWPKNLEVQDVELDWKGKTATIDFEFEDNSIIVKVDNFRPQSTLKMVLNLRVQQEGVDGMIVSIINLENEDIFSAKGNIIDNKLIFFK